LFTSLCAQIDGGHFINALKTCDKILRIDPNDKDALQTKLFLLLQTEQYDAALSLIGNGNKGSDSEHAFERTYSLYRVQREQEAVGGLKVLKEGSNEEDERGVLHLEAQLNYRQGSYQSAFDLYNQLLDTAEPQSEEHSDVLTNLTASQKHLDFINTDFLRALDALPISVTTNIETNPPPQPASSFATTAATLASSTAANVDTPAATAQPAKKVRMSRVPKGVTPGVTPPPDPERWLKKSERSTFGQGRKRRGGAGGGGGTQGSTVDSAGSGGGGASASSHNVKSGKGKKKK
jgi:signal recognition particle subunit SRP72